MSDDDMQYLLQARGELVGGWDAFPGLAAELEAIAAESIGWVPLEQGAYLHLGGALEPSGQMVIDVVGSITADMDPMNVLLLT